MATFSELYSGSATVSTTEYSLTANSTTLGAITTDGTYEIVVDVSAMVAGDQYEFKVYEKTRAADSQMLILPAMTLTGSQPAALIVPVPILLHGWEVTAKKLAGTDRILKWSIRSIS